MNRFTTMRPTRASSARNPVARVSSAIGVALLSACAGYGPGDLRSGQSEAELRARMGEPTGRYALADGGAKVEFARGPMGKHTYMVDVDAAGRVRGWEQVLTQARFEALPMAALQADVRQQLGRPSETRVGWRGVGEVWSYRYESLFCRWFQVWLVEGRVREAAFAEDPTCAEQRREND
jgi:hypothetical protein